MKKKESQLQKTLDSLPQRKEFVKKNFSKSGSHFVEQSKSQACLKMAGFIFEENHGFARKKN